jgi:hypothetical protein
MLADDAGGRCWRTMLADDAGGRCWRTMLAYYTMLGACYLVIDIVIGDIFTKLYDCNQ